MPAPQVIRPLLAAGALVAALALQLLPTQSVGASSLQASLAVTGGAEVRSVYVRLPQGPSNGDPPRVLVALHGMGGAGEDFARDLTDAADRNNWLIVAPTIAYGDWMNPAQVATEDPALIEWLAEYIDNLPSQLGTPVKRRIFLLGHSRGAQLASRFALVYPEKVMAVAALSGGTYTLPTATNAAFPFGVGDLAQRSGRAFNPILVDTVDFLVGVGSDDNNPADLPRAWDQYIGTTRVQRARSFAAAVKDLGGESTLAIFPGAQHGLTPEMRQRACAFLQKTALADAGLLSPGLRLHGFLVS